MLKYVACEVNWIIGDRQWLNPIVHSHSTNDTNLPVRPPILPKAWPTPWAAPLIAGPADDVTLESPCEAFDVILDAASLDFVAVLEAASAACEVVEAWRWALRRARARE